MAINLLYYNIFDEDGGSEVEEPIEVGSKEELTKMVKANYFCVNSIQKLFSNLKINEIMIGFHEEDQLLSGIYDLIEKENYAKYRKNIVDLNVVLYADSDSEILKKLSEVSEAEDILSTTFLGLEYLLLKKIREHYKKAILSPYANRLVSLAETIYNKKFYEIKIDDNFSEKIVQHQLNSEKEFKKAKSKIESYSTRLKIIDLELEKLNKEIKDLSSDNKKNEKKYISKIEELKEIRIQFVKERLTIFDKTKIILFKFFGFTEKIENVYFTREQYLKNKSTFVSRLFEEEEILTNRENQRIENFNETKEKISKSIQDKSRVKISLAKNLKEAKVESTSISKILINPDGSSINNNIDLVSVKSISKLSSDNILFIHLFPKSANLKITPLEEYAEMIDRSNIIRVFNPEVECEVYPIIGDGYAQSIQQYNKSDFGVLLSKGTVEYLKDINENVTINDNFEFKEKISELKSNSNLVLEAMVDKAEVYGYVSFLDNIIQKDQDKKIKVSKIIEAYEYLSKFNQHAEKNNLKAIPMIFIINGEILEIDDLKFDKYKLSANQKEVRLDTKQALIFVRKTFRISKNISKSIEITLQRDIVSEKVKEDCTKKMMEKFKTYYSNDNKISEKDEIKNSSIEEDRYEERQNEDLPSMWTEDDEDNFKISIK